MEQKYLFAKEPFEEVPGGIRNRELFKIHIDKILLPQEFLL